VFVVFEQLRGDENNSVTTHS